MATRSAEEFREPRNRRFVLNKKGDKLRHPDLQVLNLGRTIRRGSRAERTIVDAIHAARPKDAILGEEGTAVDGVVERQVIDPAPRQRIDPGPARVRSA